MAEAPPPGGGGFSLSLGAGKRPARKLDVQDREEGPKREAVLGFGAAGGLRTAEPAAAPAGPLVIPKQQNSFRRGGGGMARELSALERPPPPKTLAHAGARANACPLCLSCPPGLAGVCTNPATSQRPRTLRWTQQASQSLRRRPTTLVRGCVGRWVRGRAGARPLSPLPITCPCAPYPPPLPYPPHTHPHTPLLPGQPWLNRR